MSAEQLVDLALHVRRVLGDGLCDRRVVARVAAPVSTVMPEPDPEPEPDADPEPDAGPGARRRSRPAAVGPEVADVAAVVVAAGRQGDQRQQASTANGTLGARRTPGVYHP